MAAGARRRQAVVLYATNVVESKVAVITPIALEHTKYLGNTLAEVAGEKAGIIKPDVAVVIGSQQPEARDMLARRCAEFGIVPTWIEHDVSVCDRDNTLSVRVDETEYCDVELRVLGRHQRTNFATAVTALHRAGVGLDADIVRSVARDVVVPGRLQVLPGRPPVMLDVSHTPESARMLVRVLEERLPGRRTPVIFSCAADKRVDEIAGVLAPVAERVLLVQMPGNRAMAMDRMLAAWRAEHPYVTESESIAVALENARDTTPDHGLIVVCGSFVLVGAAMESLGYVPE